MLDRVLKSLERQILAEPDNLKALQLFIDNWERAGLGFEGQDFVIDCYQRLARHRLDDLAFLERFERAWIQSGRDFDGRPTVEHWMESFYGQESGWPIHTLGSMGPEAVPGLARGCLREQHHHRYGCFMSIEVMGQDGRACKQALIATFEDLEHWYWDSALTALMAIEPDGRKIGRELCRQKRAVEALAQALNRRAYYLLGDKHEWVLAVLSGCEQSVSRVHELFDGVIRADSSRRALRVARALAVMKSFNQYSVRSLSQGLRSTREDVRQVSLKALLERARGNDEALLGVIEALKFETLRVHEVQAFAWERARGARAVVPVLIRALNSRELSEARAAARSLVHVMRLGRRPLTQLESQPRAHTKIERQLRGARAALLLALRTGGVLVQLEILKSLSVLELPREELLRVVKDFMKARDARLRYRAVRQLIECEVMYPWPEGVSRLLRTMSFEDRDPGVRRVSARLLRAR